MTPQLPIVTSLYAGLLGIVLLVLSGMVIRYRLRNKVSLGDGGNPDLQRAMRVHGNFIEYVPLALLLIALCEIGGMSRPLLHAAGLALLIGRLLHAYGLTSAAGTSFGRFVGTNLTFIVIAATAIASIVRALQAGVM